MEIKTNNFSGECSFHVGLKT